MTIPRGTTRREVCAGEVVEVVTRGGIYLTILAVEDSRLYRGLGWIVFLHEAMALYRNGRWILDMCLFPGMTIAGNIARKQDLYLN